MAEKDYTEKTLEAYNDVFSDIVNVLLFHGENVVKEDELEDSSVHSVYKTDGRLHEQERDVAKYWKNTGVRIALYGVENQSASDPDMPLRVIGYDGAAYRSQLLNSSRAKDAHRYPVVTLVLYFGTDRHWSGPTSLLERVDVPPGLEPFVNDYKINLFEIAWLTEEQLKLFRSDFGIIAEFFVRTRKKEDYRPRPDVIKHVHEVLELMSIFSQGDKFEYVMNSQQAREGRIQTMSDVLDMIEARGEAKGIEIGEARGEARGIEIGEARGIEIGKVQGIERTLLQSTRNLMERLKLTCEEAMDILQVPAEDRAKYAERLKSE